MSRSSRRVLLIAVIGVLALIAAACSSGTTESTTANQADPTPEETTEEAPAPEPTATAEPEPVRGEILESFVGATLAGAPIVDGGVMVYWNNGSNGTLIAIYHGPGIADETGLCPGNSLSAGGTFSFISNSPADAGACDGFPTDVSSVRVCTAGVWLYESLIPNDSEGTLFGSLEMLSSEGAILNMTSQAVNTPGTPMIDYSADVFTIPEKFTNDGSTEITCATALT